MLLPVRCAVCATPGASPCAGCVAGFEPAPPQPVPLGLDDCFALLSYDGPARELVRWMLSGPYPSGRPHARPS